MKQQQEYRIGPGMTSLLMIFVVLCMVALAILTLASVQVDNSLNARSYQANEAFYQASVDVQKTLFDVDQKLLAARTAANGDVATYAAQIAKLGAKVAPAAQDAAADPNAPMQLAIVVPVDKDRQIQAEISIPQSLTGPRYQLVAHRAINVSSWDAEQNIGLYQPAVEDAAPLVPIDPNETAAD